MIALMLLGLLCQSCRGWVTHTAVQTISTVMANGRPVYARETDVKLATHEQHHLRMDVLARWMPEGAQPCLTLLLNLVAASGRASLAQAAWAFVQFERESGTVLSVGLAVWMVQSIMPLGFALMALRFALRMLEALAQLRKHLGIIFLTNLENGYSTSPVGLNLFLGSLRFERSITQLYRASWPFLIVLGLALLLITYVPELSLMSVQWFGYADLPVLAR